jgi:hypothetical protein
MTKRMFLTLSKIEPQFLSLPGRNLITTPTELSRLQKSYGWGVGGKTKRIKELLLYNFVRRIFTGGFFLRKRNLTKQMQVVRLWGFMDYKKCMS